MSIAFGPAGNSDSFYAQGHKSTAEQPAWLFERGLSAYEYSCGRGVRLKEETAAIIGENAKEYGIRLSLHAPYYINMATTETKKQENSIQYVLDAAQAAAWMGAQRVIFHPGVEGHGGRKTSFERICALLKQTIAQADERGFGHITLCPETMGRIKQIGDLEETLLLCKLDERLIPCVDFGHLHARSLGIYNGEDCYRALVDAMESALGRERTKNMHVHFSRIEFTKAGEKRHWNYEDTAWT